MPKFEVEYRVVEIHTYEVEAHDADEAVDKCWEIDPSWKTTISAEVESVDQMMTHEDYLVRRREQLSYLSGEQK